MPIRLISVSASVTTTPTPPRLLLSRLDQQRDGRLLLALYRGRRQRPRRLGTHSCTLSRSAMQDVDPLRRRVRTKHALAETGRYGMQRATSLRSSTTTNCLQRDGLSRLQSDYVLRFRRCSWPVMPSFEVLHLDGSYRVAFRSTGTQNGMLFLTETRTGNAMLRAELFEPNAPGSNPAFGAAGKIVTFPAHIERGRVFTWCNDAAVLERVPPTAGSERSCLKRALLRGQMALTDARSRP